MNYNIIRTGSKGNAVVIGGVLMVDCGVPFKLLKDVYKDLRIVLMTHCHSDHFCKSTIKKLAAERPGLRWGVGEWMARPLVDQGVAKNRIDIFDFGIMYDFCDFAISTFPLYHNAPNCGYHIKLQGKDIFYATDTGSLDGLALPDFDLIMIEANYTDAEIEQTIAAKMESGEFCYETAVVNNHLSKAQADDFISQHLKPGGEYQYIHQHQERENANAK